MPPRDICEIIIVTGDGQRPKTLRPSIMARRSAEDIPVVVYRQKEPGVGMAARP